MFPNSVAAFLGIPSPVVPVGDTTFPVLTSDPAAGTPAENAAQSETTGAFSADVLTPKRIQASFFWSREDQSRMAGMGDALREALQGGIADKLDKEILVGTNGLLTWPTFALSWAPTRSATPQRNSRPPVRKTRWLVSATIPVA